MFYVYIIFSEKLNRYYVGTTDDVEQRLKAHNEKLYVKSFTAKGIPWELKQHFEFRDGKKAYAFERFAKRMKSRKFIERLIDEPEIVDSIKLKL